MSNFIKKIKTPMSDLHLERYPTSESVLIADSTINQFSAVALELNLTKIADPINGNFTTGQRCAHLYANNSLYLATVHTTTPFLTIYKETSDGVFTKLANPSVLPTGNVTCCKFYGDTLILGLAVSPYLEIYRRSGDTFTKMANPTTLPKFSCYSVDIAYHTPTGSVMVCAIGISSPTIKLYTLDTSTSVLTSISAPSVLPSTNCRDCVFSKDGKYLAIGSASGGIFVDLYSISQDGNRTFTKYAAPSILPPGACYGLDFNSVYNGSPSHLILTTSSASPYNIIYKINGGTMDKTVGVETLTIYSYSTRSSSSNGFLRYFTFGLQSAPYLELFKQITYNGDIFKKVESAVPPTALTSMVNYSEFSSDFKYLFVITSGTPFLTIYKIYKAAYSLSNQYAVGTREIGRMLESGTIGQYKMAEILLT